MKLVKCLVALVCLATLSVNFSCNKKSDTPAASGKKQIAVIAKSTFNAYWEAVHAGAQKAADEDGVEIIWMGPNSETDHEGQMNMIDNMVNRQVAGIVLAPTNVTAQVRPIDSAVAKGIPVVLIDSTCNTKSPTSVIATDNYAAGTLAAETLIKAMGAAHKHGGKVIMLRYLEGSGSTEAREKGFAERIAKEPGLTLVSQMYIKGQGTTSDAADTANALLVSNTNTKDHVLDADGIFASNQPTAIGMLNTLDKYKAGGNTCDAQYVGFDSHDLLLAGVRDGRIAAIVVQDPTKMGYLGVKTMTKVLGGQKVDAQVDTPAVAVNKANIDDPAIKIVTLQK